MWQSRKSLERQTSVLQHNLHINNRNTADQREVQFCSLKAVPDLCLSTRVDTPLPLFAAGKDPPYFLSEVGNPTQSGPIRFRRPYLLPVGVLVWVL
jgi:hypothetical protein